MSLTMSPVEAEIARLGQRVRTELLDEQLRAEFATASHRRALRRHEAVIDSVSDRLDLHDLGMEDTDIRVSRLESEGGNPLLAAAGVLVWVVTATVGVVALLGLWARAEQLEKRIEGLPSDPDFIDAVTGQVIANLDIRLRRLEERIAAIAELEARAAGLNSTADRMEVALDALRKWRIQSTRSVEDLDRRLNALSRVVANAPTGAPSASDRQAIEIIADDLDSLTQPKESK